MSKAQPKIELAPLPADTLLLIAVAQLLPSPSNMRKSKGAVSIEELAGSIASTGLLQNIVVTERDDGKYEVVAGNRRLHAIKHAIKTKRLPKNYEVPCRVVDGADAAAASLTENFHRVAAHPADEFEAFAKLVHDGQSASDVAAQFGVSVLYVEQRMKLANVAPQLRQLFRENAISFDCIKAFAITDDHSAQLEVFNNLPQWNLDAFNVKRALINRDVRGDDPRVRYVGLDAYRAAGGQERRDLFAEGDKAITLTDSALLDRLTVAKLTKAKAKVAKEGWGWVEVAVRADHAALARFGRLDAVARDYTDDERARVNALEAELDAIAEKQSVLSDASELGEEAYDAAFNALDDEETAVRAKVDAIDEARLVQPSDEAKALAGALLYVDVGGNRVTERGLVRPEDRIAMYAALRVTPPASVANARERTATADEGEEVRRTISDALARRLSAFRTMALRLAVVENPNAALVATVHSLLLRVMTGGRGGHGCLDLHVRDEARLSNSPGVGEGKAATALAERTKVLLEGVPKDSEELWAWLEGQPLESLVRYLALGVSAGVNATQDREDANRTFSGCNLAITARLAALVKLDMAASWEANADTYLGSVCKERIAEAVAEACGADRGRSVANLKKGEAVKAAESLLAGTRWLPPMLRT